MVTRTPYVTDSIAPDKERRITSPWRKDLSERKEKKWYHRFCVKNESGSLVQKAYAGTESKSETEALLRKVMEDYEAKKFAARSENVTAGDCLFSGALTLTAH